MAAHGAACLVANQYGPVTYHRLFSPRFSSPASLVLGIFATSSPFELVWLSGSILGVGAELQRSLEEVVMPVWAQLFSECAVPCDELTAPPREFAAGLSVLKAEGVLGDSDAGQQQQGLLV